MWVCRRRNLFGWLSLCVACITLLSFSFTWFAGPSVLGAQSHKRKDVSVAFSSRENSMQTSVIAALRWRQNVTAYSKLRNVTSRYFAPGGILSFPQQTLFMRVTLGAPSRDSHVFTNRTHHYNVTYSTVNDTRRFIFENATHKLHCHRYENDTGEVAEGNCELIYDVGRHKTCAVVGNGGILQNSRCGSAIDGHDYVIRCNMAPLKGFHGDVGSKTDLSVLNSESMQQFYDAVNSFNLHKRQKYLQRLKSLNGSTLCYAKGIVRRDAVRNYDVIAQMVRQERLSIRTTYTVWNFVRPAKRAMEELGWQGDTPTTGLTVLLMASSFCDRISLYGFYPFMADNNNRRLNYNYYESGTDQLTGKLKEKHSYSPEFELLQSLNRNGILRHVTDKCQVKG